MKRHDLDAHPFPKKVLDVLEPFLSRVGEDLIEVVKTSGSFPAQAKSSVSKELLTDKIIYTVDVFELTSSLIMAMDRLEEIQEYIQIFPNTPAIQGLGITRDRWISYHYSYCVITKITIRDICLRLTNAVFKLQIPERQCSLKNIQGNSLIKGSEIDSTLNSLWNTMGAYYKDRNSYIHEGLLPDLSKIDDSDSLKMYKAIKLINFTSIYSDKAIIDSSVIDAGFEEWVKVIFEKIEQEKKDEVELISKLFDEFLGEYLRNIDLL